jgi:glycosyltransferase involved in cell wall biosynthesis
VLIVNKSNSEGGAAKASYRLFESLSKTGIDTIFLSDTGLRRGRNVVLCRTTKRAEVASLIRSKLDSVIHNIYFNRSVGRFRSSFISNRRVVRAINRFNADLVHLHWVNDGFLSASDIKRIKAPKLWSMHDMNPVTGGCHYSGTCGNYSQGCGNCPLLNSNHSLDLSRIIASKKQKSYENSDLTFIGLSEWITDTARRSFVGHGKQVYNLPNCINTSLFKTMDKEFCRRLWNIETGGTVVMFGAVNSKDDPRKGFQLLNEAINNTKTQDLSLVIFGSNKEQDEIRKDINVYNIGVINDEVALIALYNAADILVVPSLEENLSNVIMESMSCGTPVVAFDIGGNSDLIDNGVNGILAEKTTSESLQIAIEKAIEVSSHLGINARRKVEEKFAYEKVSLRYLKLYEHLVAKD